MILNIDDIVNQLGSEISEEKLSEFLTVINNNDSNIPIIYSNGDINYLKNKWVCPLCLNVIPKQERYCLNCSNSVIFD